MFGVFLFLTYYLQRTLHYSPVTTGLAFIPMVCLMIVTSMTTTNVLVPRFGAKPIVPLGMGIAAAALVWMTSLDLTSRYLTHVLPALLVLGLGLGAIFATVMNLATYGVAARDAGVASAMVSTSQQVGGSIGTALLNTLATSAAMNYLSDRMVTPASVARAQLQSYSTAYWWSAGFFLIGLVVTAVLYPRGAPRTQVVEESAPVRV